MWFKRLLCRFGWHEWTPWSAPERLPDGRSQQLRACQQCKKMQRHYF